METKEAALLSALVIFVCFTVSVRADAEDDIAYQSGGGDATEFGQAKAVRCVSHMIWRKEVKSHVNNDSISNINFQTRVRYVYLPKIFIWRPKLPTRNDNQIEHKWIHKWVLSLIHYAQSFIIERILNDSITKLMKL